MLPTTIKFERENMKYPMIRITWLDACQYTIPGAEQYLKNVLEIAKLKEITDIGFLLEKTDEKIVFCSKITGEGKFDKVSAVPAGWVKRIDYLWDTKEIQDTL